MILHAISGLAWWVWLLGMVAGAGLTVWAVSEWEDARADVDADVWAWMREAAR